MKYLKFTFLFFIIFCNPIYSQFYSSEDTVRLADSIRIHQKLDSVFMNLNKTKITTGFLFERIIEPLSGMQHYSGHTDSIIRSGSWWQMYFELKNFAAVVPTALPSLSDFIQQVKDSNAANLVPFGIFNLNINRIKTYALDSGLIDTLNGQLFETSNPLQTPYETKRIFACTYLGTLYAYKTMRFLMDTSFYFSNTSETLLKFEIDFGDGNGYRTIHFGEIVTVNYSDTGQKIIHTMAVFPTDTLQSRTLAFVGGKVQTQNKLVGSGSCKCDDFIYAFDHKDYFPPDKIFYMSGGSGYAKGGRGYVKLSGANTDVNDNPVLKKPFIFVEGIDFGKAPDQQADDDDYGTRYGALGWQQIILATQFIKDNPEDPIEEPKERPDDNIKKVPILMNKLCSEGYDLIMLDFEDGAIGINENAMVLVDLIQQVNNDLRTNGSKQQIVVMGVSMGGQVSRYALRYMELNESTTGPHNTRMFISFDSPNRGANIALGTQYAISYATGYVGTQTLMDALFRPATKQLMVYHYNASDRWNKKAYPYDEHTTLYSSVYMATFPQKPYLVAISNGSGYGERQGYWPGDLTINLLTPRVFRARAVGDKNQEVKVFSKFYETVITWIEDIVSWFSNWLGDWFSEVVGFVIKTVYILTEEFIEIDNTLPYDNTSGGYRNTNEFFAISLPSGGLLNLHAESGRHNHSFIPTYSALGIPLVDENTLKTAAKDILGAASFPFHPHDQSKTPFDVVYAPQYNQQHVNITDENIGWIMSEVSPRDYLLNNNNLYLQNKTIERNDPAMIGYGFESYNNIYIGSDVDPLKSPTYQTTRTFVGNFVIDGDGSNGAIVDMRAGREISIKNNTWFKKGSNVHLFIDPFPCAAVHRMANPNLGDGEEENNQSTPVYNWNDSKDTSTIFKSISKQGGLSGNYPNPFSDHTHIDYLITDSGAVNISVYDISGQKVAILVNLNNQLPGKYTATLDARKLSPGIYFCRMEAENYSETKKMIMMK